MKLLVDPHSGEYYVYWLPGGFTFLYKVENFNPPMLKRIVFNGIIEHSEYLQKIKELEEFVFLESKKMNDGW